jgi:hypothetical protein
VTHGNKVLSFFGLAAMMVFAACGGNNNLTLQNPSAPEAQAVSIAFSPKPTASLSLAATTTLTAVVSGDSTDAGVDWVLLCSTAGNCGTLQPQGGSSSPSTTTHTASGSPVTYTPPQSITGNSQSVTVEAFATANHNSNTNAALTITGFASNLKGTYVFETTGSDGNVGAFELAGVVVLDGNGNVTSGEQTYCDAIAPPPLSQPSLVSVADKITGGSYYIGPDGRGTLTLNTADKNVGQLGIENFALVYLSNSKALIQTFDSNTNVSLPPSNEASAGTLDRQTSATSPSGGYAFVLNGIDTSISASPLTIGGVFDIDSPNTISGAGSVADEDDNNILTSIPALSGTVTSPDSLGSVNFSLTASNPTTFPPFSTSWELTGYIVDATHIKLIETNNNGTLAGSGITAGVAVGQGAATGTFNNNSTFAGNYVFDIAGEDPSGVPDTLASVGELAVDSNGNLSSAYDDEYLVNALVGFTDSFTGTYVLYPSGTGRVDTNSSITFNVNGQGPELIFYLTGNGDPPLILDADDNQNSLGNFSTGIGFAHPQAGATFSFSGKYGVEFTDSQGLTPNTATGRVTATESAGTLSGIVDTNFGFNPQPNFGLNGTFGDISTSGRFTGTLENTLFPSPSTVPSTVSVAFYPVDDDLIFFIETDFALTFQSMSGHFSGRTSVCNLSACP